MNISNAVYKFTKKLIGDSSSNTFLYGAELHLGIFGSFEKPKTIRISESFGGKPHLEDGQIKDFNAKVFVYFVVKPEAETHTGLFEARRTATEMADEWLMKLFETNSLADCMDVGAVERLNSWIMPSNTRMPVCRLELTIYPR